MQGDKACIFLLHRMISSDNKAPFQVFDGLVDLCEASINIWSHFFKTNFPSHPCHSTCQLFMKMLFTCIHVTAVVLVSLNSTHNFCVVAFW